ncbi:F-box/LRR-repeat protein At1g55660-like [Silene latifolia]|uniref:F-box/LRR-repeat protein At1g55660-like n=1 Tax=Silene latifolia TaxID=37657 RepID=UPI003D78811A
MQDKISQLPDDILLSIVSILDFKTVVRTSILAKRWKYLWTWLCDLDFHPKNLFPANHDFFKRSRSIGDDGKKKFQQGYMNWINQVIHSHRAPCITKFSLFFPEVWSKDMSEIEKWIRFAVSKQVEELDLTLLDYRDHPPRVSLGSDILNHSITNLKSLSMSNVNISGEALESVLFHCHLLERLYVDDSDTLQTLTIVSYKLKHLTLIECKKLNELQIDAVNLISFYFQEYHRGVPVHIVFKMVPNLVEVDFGMLGCTYPFRILERFSCVSKQLTKLSFCPFIDYATRLIPSRLAVIQVNVFFPYVKQLTLTVLSLSSFFFQLFIPACPMLHELKLQVTCDPGGPLKDEADQLREIELEDERNDEMPMNQESYSEGEKEKSEHEVNLKVLEIVGFHGCNEDVKCALEIIARAANSMERLICELRHLEEIIEDPGPGLDEDVFMAKKRSRAHKLVKLVPPRVHVGVRDKSGLSWIS